MDRWPDRVRSPGRDPGETIPVPTPATSPSPAEFLGATPEEESADITSGVRILIVDDHHDSADSLSKVLRLLGYRVEIAYDGPGALEAASESPPDVAIVDIGLPRVDGNELARRIRAQPWGGRVLLVALTGWTGDDHRQRSMEAGFDHHFIKPVELDALMSAMGGLVAGSPAGPGCCRAGGGRPS
jgi:CheY-like chemotaxis protein